MYKAYMEGKDLYAMIAQSAYNNNYEDNLEFWPAGTELEIDGQKVIAGNKTHLNKDGKARRSVGKVLNLASTYGMSGHTAGLRLGYTGKDASKKGSELLNNFFVGFGGVKTAIDQSKEFLKKNGYVEDFTGRRRRLDDIYLPPYEARVENKQEFFNPILDCKEHDISHEPEQLWQQILACEVLLCQAYKASRPDKYPDYTVSNEMFNSTFDNLKKIAEKPKYMLDAQSTSKYKHQTNRQKLIEDFSEFQKLLSYGIYDDGKGHSFKVSDNKGFEALLNDYKKLYGNIAPKTIPETQVTLYTWTGKIAKGYRQCFNARIQGSAATLTKLAMVDIARDELMKEYQAQLIIPVHDELLVECPAYYADKVAVRLPELMVGAAKRAGDDVPQSCDPYNVSRWASDVCAAFDLDELKKLEAKGMEHDKAFAEVKARHPEVPEDALEAVLEGKADELIF